MEKSEKIHAIALSLAKDGNKQANQQISRNDVLNFMRRYQYVASILEAYWDDKTVRESIPSSCNETGIDLPCDYSKRE